MPMSIRRFARSVSPRLLDRARLLAGAMRVAYVVSAGMADVLPRTPIALRQEQARFSTLPPDLADLASERLNNRLKQLAKLVGREPAIQIGANAKTANGPGNGAAEAV